MKRILRALSRVLAFAFNLVLVVFLLGLGLLGWSTGGEVRLEVIPGVSGKHLILTLLVVGLYGLIALALAFMSGKLARVPMLLWNLLVPSILLCAFIRPSYAFEGMAHFWNMVILFAISLVALWGSWIHLRTRAVAKEY